MFDPKGHQGVAKLTGPPVGHKALPPGPSPLPQKALHGPEDAVEAPPALECELHLALGATGVQQEMAQLFPQRRGGRGSQPAASSGAAPNRPSWPAETGKHGVEPRHNCAGQPVPIRGTGGGGGGNSAAPMMLGRGDTKTAPWELSIDRGNKITSGAAVTWEVAPLALPICPAVDGTSPEAAEPLEADAERSGPEPVGMPSTTQTEWLASPPEGGPTEVSVVPDAVAAGDVFLTAPVPDVSEGTSPTPVPLSHTPGREEPHPDSLAAGTMNPSVSLLLFLLLLPAPLLPRSQYWPLSLISPLLLSLSLAPTPLPPLILFPSQ
ncbi:hypothetical protein UY3_03098 [Chelonia mydas]|uniref:Uncharacterized protein n=1 Tax=Chelonia mydas TaxID=8469 RepID=M7BR63_CHEMY|nr:hypothetical protein UY3_03098 [Chelonia mydas]